MALREVLAELDVRVHDAEQMVAANAALGSIVINLRAAGPASAGLNALGDGMGRTKQAAGGFVSGLRGAQAAFGAFVAAIGARRVIEGVARMVGEVIQVGDELHDASQELGVSTTELQRWRYAAGRSGVEAGAMQASFRRLQRAAFEGSRGSRTSAEYFRMLGVELRGADGQLKGSGQLMEEVTVALAGVESQTERAGLAQRLFGQSGSRLLPLLADGSAGVRELMERFRELGGGISEDVVERAAEADDALFDFRFALLGIKSALSAEVLPAITRAITSVASFLGRVSEIVRTSNFAKVALGALAIIFGALALAMLPAVVTVGIFVLALVALALVVDDIVTAFTGGNSLFAEWVEQLAAAQGITLSFAGIVEMFGVAWEIAIARALTAIDELLDALPNIRHGLGGLGVDIREGAEIQRNRAQNAEMELRRNELRRQVQDAQVHAQARTAAAPVVEPRSARERRRDSERAARVIDLHSAITINGAQDPQAVAREVDRHIRRTLREAAADDQPLAPEAT